MPDIQAMLDAAEGPVWKQHRDRLILSMLADSGLDLTQVAYFRWAFIERGWHHRTSVYLNRYAAELDVMGIERKGPLLLSAGLNDHQPYKLNGAWVPITYQGCKWVPKMLADKAGVKGANVASIRRYWKEKER
jgi:hypothetical protein